MKKHLLVDVDGTLIDSYPGIRESFIHGMNAHGFEAPGEEFLRGLPGPPMRESIAAAGVPEDQVGAVLASYREHHNTTGWKNSQLFPGMAELLEQWKAQGHVMATATSKAYSGTIRVLEHYGLLAYFDYLGTAEDNNGPRQHKADVVAYAMELVGADHPATPEDFLLIGDRKHDAEGAAEHGIDCVLVKWGYGDGKELALVPQVADTPGELARIVEQA